MSKLRESVVFAALATIMISIPAASQSVQISETDNFSGSIDSKFSGMFNVDFQPGKMIMAMMSQEAKLEVNQSFNKRVVKLQTPEGFFKKVKTNDSITKIFQTPYGRFESGIENGENFSTFDGGEREKAEEIRERLEQKVDEKLGEAKSKKQVVVSRILPNIELEVETEDSIEHFNLTNNGDKTIDVEGWKIVTEGGEGDTMNLDSEIKPGEKLVFYSRDREDVKGAEGATYGTGLTIYSNNGAVKLYNENERLVDSYSY